MRFKKRSDFETQGDWLIYLFNDIGCSNLALQMSGKTQTGEVWFSKRYSYMDLIHKDPWEYIPIGTNVNSKKIMVKDFILEATHRTILDIEFIFDVDDEPIFETAKKIMNKYKENNPVCYFTGSKSYHIHIFDERLRDHYYKKYKDGVLLQNNSDGGKGSERQLIAIEGAKHYRSGKIKEEVQI